MGLWGAKTLRAVVSFPQQHIAVPVVISVLCWIGFAAPGIDYEQAHEAVIKAVQQVMSGQAAPPSAGQPMGAMGASGAMYTAPPPPPPGGQSMMMPQQQQQMGQAPMMMMMPGQPAYGMMGMPQMAPGMGMPQGMGMPGGGMGMPGYPQMPHMPGQPGMGLPPHMQPRMH